MKHSGQGVEQKDGIMWEVRRLTILRRVTEEDLIRKVTFNKDLN